MDLKALTLDDLLDLHAKVLDEIVNRTMHLSDPTNEDEQQFEKVLP